MPVRITVFLSVFIALLGAQARAQEASADDQARFLAGLPMAGSPLFALSQHEGWAAHAAAFDRSWAALEKRQFAPIRSWMNERFASTVAETDPLLYMFSGPDFLYAHAFFPNASTYVLCGIEPIGPIPDIAKIPAGSVGPALAGLRKSLDSVLSFSFFITKDMKSDLQNTRLTGTLPVLFTFLARSGCHIDEVRNVAVQPDGTLGESGGPSPGVKITFTQAGHAPQTVYYFSTDLADWAQGKSGFLKWLESLGKAHSFLKAASYLMHGGNFTKIRQRLLDQSTFIVEDDSGIPVRNFEPNTWHLGVYGRYLGPIPIFKQGPQPQLQALFGKHGAESLPFSFGYRWHPSESTLIAATRLAPIVEKPKAEEAPAAK